MFPEILRKQIHGCIWRNTRRVKKYSGITWVETYKYEPFYKRDAEALRLANRLAQEEELIRELHAFKTKPQFF